MADYRIKTGTSIVLAWTDHAPGSTYYNLGTKTAGLTIDLRNLGNTVCAQSDKFDMQTPRGSLWAVTAAIEPVSAPAVQRMVNFYMGFSNSATAGQDNPGKLSGVAAIYQGYGSSSAAGLEGLRELHYVGGLISANNGAVQVAHIGVFRQKLRYGMVVVENQLGPGLKSNGISMSVRLTPIEMTNA